MSKYKEFIKNRLKVLWVKFLPRTLETDNFVIRVTTDVHQNPEYRGKSKKPSRTDKSIGRNELSNIMSRQISFETT